MKTTRRRFLQASAFSDLAIPIARDSATTRRRHRRLHVPTPVNSPIAFAVTLAPGNPYTVGPMFPAAGLGSAILTIQRGNEGGLNYNPDAQLLIAPSTSTDNGASYDLGPQLLLQGGIYVSGGNVVTQNQVVQSGLSSTIFAQMVLLVQGPDVLFVQGTFQ